MSTIGLRPLATYHQPPITDRQTLIVGHLPPATKLRLGHSPPTAELQPLATHRQSPVTSRRPLNVECRTPIFGRWPSNARLRLPTFNHQSPNAGLRPPTINHRLSNIRLPATEFQPSPLLVIEILFSYQTNFYPWNINFKSLSNTFLYWETRPWNKNWFLFHKFYHAHPKKASIATGAAKSYSQEG